MRLLFLSIFMTFIIGCSDTTENSKEGAIPQNSFNIALSPSLAPASQSTIAISSILLLDVSTPLDAATVTENTVYIQDIMGNNHPAYVSLIDQQIVIEPKFYLEGDTTFEIVVTTDVTSTAGEQLIQNRYISFTSGTSADTYGPTLVATLPEANSSAMEPFATIYFQFSEPISPLINPDLIRMYDPVNNLYVLGKTKRSDRHLSFTPESNLTYSKNYVVELNTSSITDMSNNDYNGSLIEKIDFNVTTFAASLPVVTRTESAQIFDTNSTINCMYDNNWTLYIGHENGLSIVKFDANSSDFSNSKYTLEDQLLASEVGVIYDISLDIAKRRAYLASSDGIYIVDINDTSNVSVVASYPTTDNTLPVPVYGIDLLGEHLYLAATTIGLIDLNISDESNISTLFTRDTNGTAFDVVVNNSNDIVVSNYDQNFTYYDINGLQLFPFFNGSITGNTHNLVTYTDNYPNTQEMVAGGISGLVYVDQYSLTPTVSGYLAPSYISQIKITNTATDNSFGIMKDLGVARFSLYDSLGGGGISNYQLLPYDATALHTKYHPTDDYTVLFIAAPDGKIHAYQVL